GYQVALNARLYSHSDNSTREDSLASAFDGGEAGASGYALTEAFSDPVFGVREMWANMAMWDADLQGHWNPDGSSIKLGILDMGLASNDDWRASCDTCLPLSIDPIWHGTGVFSIAGGMLNNGVGTVGTGGQVVVPKTYCMSALDYVSHVSENITQAVDDGADIVNVSWGYPCRFLLSLGTENACTAGSRIALLAKLDLLAST